MNLPGFAEAFGQAKSYGPAISWRLSPVVIGYAGCKGADGFERVHVYFAEDTLDAVRRGTVLAAQRFIAPGGAGT